MFSKKCICQCLRLMFIFIGLVNIIFILYILKPAFEVSKSPITKSPVLTTFTAITTAFKSQTNHTKQAVNYKEESFYSKRSHVVNKFTHNFLITPAKTCPSNVDVVIVVHNEASSVKVRQAIRHTWGSLALNSAFPSTWPQYGSLKLTYSLFFIFGTSKDPGLNDLLQEENQSYGDIIQGDFFDSYTNMTLKSLLGLKFFSEFCSSAKHFIKSDSDMFLNLPYITEFLSQNPFSHSILGPICVASPVHRSGKWGISKEDFPFETFPVYEAGSAYIISADLCNEILLTSDYVPHIYIDDVYITGIIGRILNVTHLDQPGFAYWTTKKYDICDIRAHKIFTTTNLKHNQISQIWEALKTQKCPA